MCWRKFKVKGAENAAAGSGECVYMSKAACKVLCDKLAFAQRSLRKLGRMPRGYLSQMSSRQRRTSAKT